MQLRHEFTVPAGIEETWAALNDIEGVAECFPGATVTSVEEDSFKGSVKVKLGPIQMVYNGTGTFSEKDESEHRMVLAAKGKDKRGNGTAGADVVATMTDQDGSTRVVVETDLAVTGKPAQFGRGVMQDVSDKLLDQFIDCLAQRVGTETGSEPEPEPESGPEPGPSSGPSPGAESGPAPGPSPGAEPGPDPVSLRAVEDNAATPVAPAAPVPPSRPANDDAIDLGATVLPVLVKTYWKPALAVLVALLVLRRLLRR